MSWISDIWDAYYKGKAAAKNDDVIEMAAHLGLGHIMAAMLPGRNSDEEIAFEKGYHKDQLELCYECQHVKENCDCEAVSFASKAAVNYGLSNRYSNSKHNFSRGDESDTERLPISVKVGGFLGFFGGVMYSGERIFEIKSPDNVGLDLLCGIPILGAVIGAVGLGIVGKILRTLIDR